MVCLGVDGCELTEQGMKVFEGRGREGSAGHFPRRVHGEVFRRQANNEGWSEV